MNKRINVRCRDVAPLLETLIGVSPTVLCDSVHSFPSLNTPFNILSGIKLFIKVERICDRVDPLSFYVRKSM